MHISKRWINSHSENSTASGIWQVAVSAPTAGLPMAKIQIHVVGRRGSGRCTRTQRLAKGV